MSKGVRFSELVETCEFSKAEVEPLNAAESLLMHCLKVSFEPFSSCWDGIGMMIQCGLDRGQDKLTESNTVLNRGCNFESDYW